MSLAAALQAVCTGDSALAASARRAHAACRSLTELHGAGKPDVAPDRCSLTGLPHQLCPGMPLVTLHGCPFWVRPHHRSQVTTHTDFHVTALARLRWDKTSRETWQAPAHTCSTSMAWLACLHGGELHLDARESWRYTFSCCLAHQMVLCRPQWQTCTCSMPQPLQGGACCADNVAPKLLPD